MRNKFNKISVGLLFVFFILCSFTVQNKTDDKTAILNLMKKTKAYYQKNRQFSFAINYNLFAGNSKKAIDSYAGFFAKKDNNYYSKIGDAEFILSGEKTIKIDNESKLMQFFNEGRSKETIIYDLANCYGNFGGFELKSDADHWICILDSREVTFMPYSKVVIYLNKKDCSIAKQELHLISPIKTGDVNGKEIYNYPVLQIIFSDLKLTEQKDDYFKVSNYIELKKGKYYPSQKYSSYQIVD